MSHCLARVRHENAQQLPLGWRQMHRLAIPGESARLEVHLQLAVEDPFAADGAWRTRSTLQRPHPSLELERAERFGDVVIGSGIEQCGLLPIGVTRGTNENQRVRRFAYLLADGD